MGNKLTVVCLVLFLGLTACANRDQPIYNVTARPMPVGAKALTIDQLERAIFDAARHRNWTVSFVEKGKLRAIQDQNKHVAVVDIAFDQSSYTITKLETRGLDERGLTISRHYNSWIRQLEDDIQSYVTWAVARR